ncbi:MAG: TetR/AcrR family transcriptional regulator [Myxococcota bacterium]
MAEARATEGDKRERILQAAIRVFAKKGFYATKVSEIAKAASVADGTIYLYFQNKEAILVSVFDDRMKALLALLERISSSQRTSEEKVQRIMELQLGLLEEERDLAEVVTVNLRQSSTFLKQYAAPLFRRYLELMADVVAAGQRDGSFRKDLNPRVVARSLFGGLDGIALTWALGAEPPEEPSPVLLRKAASQFSALFLAGLRAGAELGAEAK